MRILVTGVTGFAGGHLAEALLAQRDHRIVGVARRSIWPDTWSHLAAQVELHECDMCMGAAVETVLRDVQPEWIYHLAGYPHVGRSFQEPEAAWQGNLTATRSLYDAVLRWGGRPRILFVGSGLVYGENAHERGRLHGNRSAAAGQSLCGEQGGGRSGQLPVHALGGAGHRPRPSVQPHRPASIAAVRRLQFRSPIGGYRTRPANADPGNGQFAVVPRPHRCPRRRRRLYAINAAGTKRRSVQRRLRPKLCHADRAGTLDRFVGHGRRGASASRSPPRDGYRCRPGQHRQAAARDGLAAPL